MRIVDLSMPIDSGHFRWPVERGKRGSFESGDVFETSWLRTSCHGFTHLDAPSHIVAEGPTTDDLDLSKVVGKAAVIDLSEIQPLEEITGAHLDTAGSHLEPGEIALFRTCWDEQRDWRSEAYWREAPWVSQEAAEWLQARGPSAVAFDFPQDWTIRRLLDGEVRPLAENVTHNLLLRNGVTLIEYLVGVRQVTQPNTLLCAQPLRLSKADGAPVRVIAIEGLI